MFLVRTDKDGEKREREREKVSWSPNRLYHFQLDLFILDVTLEQFSHDSCLSLLQLVVDSSTATVESHGKGERELTPKCEEHRHGAI